MHRVNLSIKQVDFNSLKNWVEELDAEGMVFVGVPDPIEKWCVIITNILMEKGVLEPSPNIKVALLDNDAKYKNDLVFLFDPGIYVDIGQMALVKNSEQIFEWLTDYVEKRQNCYG